MYRAFGPQTNVACMHAITNSGLNIGKYVSPLSFLDEHWTILPIENGQKITWASAGIETEFLQPKIFLF